MGYRFFLTGRSGVREVTPANNRTLEFIFSKESNRADFKRELEGSIILVGEDFHWLYHLERLVYRCDLVNLLIHKNCEGVWVEDWFEGDISLNSGQWDVDHCKVELSIRKFDRYQCYDNHSSEEVNVLQYVHPKREVHPKEGSIQNATFQQYVGPNDSFDWFPGETDPESKGWIVRQHSFMADSIGDDILSGMHRITWVREVKNSSTALSGWIYLGANQYARPPILYDRRDDPYNSNSPNSWGFTWKVLTNPIDNGMLLYDVFNMFIGRICPSLTIESDFFQWNPEEPTGISYVTGLPNKAMHLVLFQKSDIKRPDNTGNATIANISFEDLLEDICNIFNLEWEITEDNKFKIEHVSYRNRVLAIDTTATPDDIRMNQGNRKYYYDNDDIPKREVFSFMDDTSYGDFKAAPILYTNSCAGNGETIQTDYMVENITTDVLHCINNPADDSKLVSDDGFVLIACTEDFAILREGSIRGGNLVNNTLAWSQLHRDYWRHNRPLLNFLMNNEETLAITVKPNKVQENVRFKLCCESDFDTDNLIKTALGDNGILKNARLNLYKGILEMTVLFPAEGTLTENDPPVANDDTADTYVNMPVKIDVLANDTDADGVIIPSTLELVGSVQNGTAEITDDYQIRFYPTADLIGEGTCRYRVQDNYGAVSNVALVTVNINGGTPLPVANGGSFIIAKNLELARPAGSIWANDTAPTPVTAVPESKATAQGGTVIINMSGSFSFVPAHDFIGTDSFDYTIKDDFGNQDTGTVTIDVFEPETVYVELVDDRDHLPEPIVEDCGDGPTIVGQVEHATYTIKTYSDEAKTIPLDVEGYNLKLNIKRAYTYFDPPSTSESTVQVTMPSGNEKLYAEDLIVYLEYNGFWCGPQQPYPQDSHFELNITLEPGDGYEI